MNTTLATSPQALISDIAEGFPQPLVEKIMAFPREKAVSTILKLFDAGAIGPATAERWLTTVETLNG